MGVDVAAVISAVRNNIVGSPVRSDGDLRECVVNHDMRTVRYLWRENQHRLQFR
jgi:hypothetical protein